MVGFKGIKMIKRLMPVVFTIISFHLLDCYTVYKPVNLICQMNPVFISNYSCRLKPINRYRTVVNLEGLLIGTLRNISVDFRTYVKNAANRYYPFVINRFANACDDFDKLQLPILQGIARKHLFKMTNANHSCPYSGWIIARNVYLDEKALPPVLAPTGSYKCVFHFMEGYPYQSVGNITFFVDIMDVKNYRNRKGT